MRTKIPNINARDVATILGINPYQTAYELLEDKIENKHPFFGNKFTEHGNRYESQAIKSFEKIINKNINSNLNNMKHPEFEWLTGRLDGILEMNEETYDDIKAQKEKWLKDHGIKWKANFVPGKRHKYKFATPDSIIIDDTFSVIEDWNKAGGIGIWHKDASSTVLQLATLLTMAK